MPVVTHVTLDTNINQSAAKQLDEVNCSNNLDTLISKKKPKSPTKQPNCSNEKLPMKESDQPIAKAAIANNLATANVVMPVAALVTPAAGKTREQIMAEREAKKLAKQAKKTKNTSDNVAAQSTIAVVDTSVVANTTVAAKTQTQDNVSSVTTDAVKQSREHIMAEREAKKQAKLAAKMVKTDTAIAQQSTEVSTTPVASAGPQTVRQDQVATEKKATLTKAERRSIQEAQRAAKAQVQAKSAALVASTRQLKVSSNAIRSATVPAVAKVAPHTPTKTINPNISKVKLFNHLEGACKDVNLFVNNVSIHPSIARLGEQYAKRTVVGSNARCIAFLNALKKVIQDFETPPKKEFSRSLEGSLKYCVEHLHRCRPLAVSVTNAYKHMKQVLTQLPTDKPESELKENLCHFIDSYLENHIGKAAQAISSFMQEKIADGDIILTFGCSSLIHYILEEAQKRQVKFRVIVVDSRPFCEGQELLRRLARHEIPCTYVLINAVGYVMPEATKVVLGAHALLSNGYVMARTGTAQVALMARNFNVPVLVCCETHKFSERFQTDAIVYNELGDPNDLVKNDKCSLTNWQSKSKMSPLNLMYDITPPELVTAVVTEVSILPCTSVPVILRIKPTEIGYYS